MRETILLIHFTDVDRKNKLTRALFPLKIKIREVEKSEYHKPIGYLAGNRELPCRTEEYQGEELSGEMMVMAGLSSAQMDRVLNAVRRSGAGPIPYKAVLTPVNQFWDVPRLFEELRQEHMAMHREGQRKEEI